MAGHSFGYSVFLVMLMLAMLMYMRQGRYVLVLVPDFAGFSISEPNPA
jgi:hypothetical protein